MTCNVYGKGLVFSREDEDLSSIALWSWDECQIQLVNIERDSMLDSEAERGPPIIPKTGLSRNPGNK